MGDDISEKIQSARKDAEKMNEEIRKNREEKNDGDLKQYTSDIPVLPRCSMKIRRTLRGHLAKVTLILLEIVSNSCFFFFF